MIVPKLVHQASNLPAALPDSFVKEVIQILFKFMYGSKWERIGQS